jgi:hypothetical protein
MRRPKRWLSDRPTFRLFLIFLAVCTFFGGAYSAHLRRLWLAAQAPEQARGVVTDKSCGKNSSIRYEFHYGGLRYGPVWGDYFGMSCRSIPLGQPVNVSYQHGAPKNSFAFAPDNDDPDRVSKEFWSGLFYLIAFMLVAPLALTTWITGVSQVFPWLAANRPQDPGKR